MAVSTYTDYLTRLNQTVDVVFQKNMISAASAYSSSWTRAQNAGATPSTSVAPTDTTTGAMNLETEIGKATNQYVIAGFAGVSGSTGQFIICDRLSHSGGLSGIVTTAQTTNLPTAALTRYTSGAGVMIGLEMYTSIGATATTATVSYTNQSGTSGRTTKDVVVGGSGLANAGRIILCPLQDGDTGVQSVQSVTLAATTGTAGDFGVTLFKPLYITSLISQFGQPFGVNIQNSLISGGMQFEPIVEGACLMAIAMASNVLNTTGQIYFMEIS